jgi:cytochrome P450
VERFTLTGPLLPWPPISMSVHIVSASLYLCHTFSSGMGDLTPIMRYGPKFQFGRRLMNTALSTRAVQKWEAGIADESQAMLKNVFSAPTDFVAHLNKWDFIHHMFTQF